MVCGSSSVFTSFYVVRALRYNFWSGRNSSIQKVSILWKIKKKEDLFDKLFITHKFLITAQVFKLGLSS